MLSGFSPALNADFTMPVIHSFGIEAIAQLRMSSSGSTPASVVWPAANQALYVPFTVSDRVTFTRAHWYNGATASGNVDVGIYNEAAARLCSTGAVAQGTINVVQTAAFTASVALNPGRYYMAMSCSSATATMFASSASLLPIMAGMYQQATAHVLPATATFATWTSTMQPLFSVSTMAA
jgi:hypothetical protein